MFSWISSPSTQQRRRLSLPLDLDIECEEPQTSSVPRSVNGLAHVGPTSSLRRSPRVKSGTCTSAICSTIYSGHAPGTGTSMLRSTVSCSTRSRREQTSASSANNRLRWSKLCRTTHNGASLLVPNFETQVARTFTVDDSLPLVLGPELGRT